MRFWWRHGAVSPLLVGGLAIVGHCVRKYGAAAPRRAGSAAITLRNWSGRARSNLLEVSSYASSRDGAEASPRLGSSINGRRAELARRLSQLYAEEVPKYGHLVDATERINAPLLSASPVRHLEAARLGCERHGAIRVASFDELSQVARLFAYFGMKAVGYYDLRDGATPIPVVSTAFRPIAADDLAVSPFRMFTSTLVADDERFFSPELQAELGVRRADRQLLPPALVTLLDRLDAAGGSNVSLNEEDSLALLTLAVDALRLNAEPIDAEWHRKLDAVSPVASDIAAARGTHLNHLTPRVLDIDALHELMEFEGVTMIDRIQGPPPWSGPDVLLRQTSFRALDETRTFVHRDGQRFEATVRVRFGEVEQRGIALTPQGRAKVDAAMAAGAEATEEDERRAAIRAELDSSLSHSLDAMAADGDAFVRYVARADGRVGVEPITYEDFLPASAAGIFASNLAHAGSFATSTPAHHRDAERLQEAVGQLHDPYALYGAEQAASLAEVEAAVATGDGPPG